MTMNTTSTSTAEKQEDPNKSDLIESQSDFCRTCLSTKHLRLIFCNSYDEEMTQKLKAVTCLEIKRDDGLSQKICNICLKTINTTFQFRMKCKEVETYLLRKVKNNIKTECVTETINLFPEASTKMEYDDLKMEIPDNTSIRYSSLMKTDPQSKKNKTNIIKIVQKIQEILKKKNSMHEEIFSEVPIEWKKKETNNGNLQSMDKNILNIEYDPSNSLNVPPVERLAEHQQILKDQKSAITKLEERKKKEIPDLVGPPYRCEICGNRYMNRLTCVRHIKKHSMAVVCEECGVTVSCNFMYLKHKRAKHGLEKIHKCENCDYSASSQELLTVHERRHRGERPYVCDYCGVGFYAKYTLLQHIGVHMPATIQCPLCPKKLRSQRLLSNHKASKHGKKYSFQCPRCPLVSKERKTIRRHLFTQHQVPKHEKLNIQKNLLYNPALVK